MIEVITPSSRIGNRKQDAHPEWESWFQASAYTPEVARAELGMANGTFYRRIKAAPDQVTKLAMAALYEGLEPWTPAADS
jgi:hypothetical protein